MMWARLGLGICGLVLCFVSGAHAQVILETVEYKHSEAVLEGFLAYDDALQTKRPGILVVHEWKGVGDYARRRATMLAEQGYVAMAVDMYGKGIHPQTHEEAAQQAGIYKNDRLLMRSRIGSALEVIREHPLVDASKLAAIGYCFGGTTVLELARSGADIKGVASFHGALETPDPQDAKNIKAKLLVCHGAADTFVSTDEVAGFKKEMTDAGVALRFESFEGAVHSFTVKEAGDDPSKGMAYHADADAKSWNMLTEFLKQIFA